MDLAAYEGSLRRDLDDRTLFRDLFTTPNYTGYSLDDIGYVLHFDGDLTAEQQAAVLLRVFSTPAEEQDRRTLRTLQGDIDALRTTSATMTPQQLTNAIKILANGIQALTRLREADLG